MCQSDNPTLEQTTAEAPGPPMGLQCSEKLPATRRRPSAVPLKMYTGTVIMNVILNSKLYTQETKIKNHTRLTKARGS